MGSDESPKKGKQSAAKGEGDNGFISYCGQINFHSRMWRLKNLIASLLDDRLINLSSLCCVYATLIYNFVFIVAKVCSSFTHNKNTPLSVRSLYNLFVDNEIM